MGTIYIPIWALYLAGLAAIILPIIVWRASTRKEREAEAQRKYDEELRKKYPGLKSFAELVREYGIKNDTSEY